jgi:hypothetical protein
MITTRGTDKHYLPCKKGIVLGREKVQTICGALYSSEKYKYEGDGAELSCFQWD